MVGIGTTDRDNIGGFSRNRLGENERVWTKYGSIAQLAEQSAVNRCVVGSSPTSSANLVR